LDIAQYVLKRGIKRRKKRKKENRKGNKGRIKYGLKTDSHIACSAHAVPLMV